MHLEFAAELERRENYEMTVRDYVEVAIQEAIETVIVHNHIERTLKLLLRQSFVNLMTDKCGISVRLPQRSASLVMFCPEGDALVRSVVRAFYRSMGVDHYKFIVGQRWVDVDRVGGAWVATYHGVKKP